MRCRYLGTQNRTGVYLNRGYDLVKFKVETVDSESTVLIDPHCQIWSDLGIPLPAMLTEADRVELLRCILVSTRSRLPKKETTCCSQTRNQEIMLVPPPKSWLNVRTRPSYMDTSTVQRECTSLPGILCASSKSSGARAMAWHARWHGFTSKCWMHIMAVIPGHPRHCKTKKAIRGEVNSHLVSRDKTASQHCRRQRVYKRALRAPCQNETKRNETKQCSYISTLMSCREIDTSYKKNPTSQPLRVVMLLSKVLTCLSYLPSRCPWLAEL